MKKLIALILALVCVFSFAACAAKTTDEETSAPSASEDVTDTQTPAEDTSDAEPEEDAEAATGEEEELPGMNEPATMPEEGAPVVDEDMGVDAPATLPEENTDAPAVGEPSEEGEQAALSILESVWALYTEDEKFPAAGGDYDAMVDGAPGKAGLTNPENLSYLLTFPADDVAKLDGAASLMHMMNANTFTCGAYHVANSEDVAAVVEDIYAAITTKQWMCGFPEQLIIATNGNLIVAAFGNLDLITTFHEKLTAADSGFTFVYDEAIVV